MKIGIDSYCYHRFFGEVYPLQQPAPYSMSLEDFIERAVELEVDGVSIESCFLPSTQPSYLQDIGARLDDHGLERVYAWGHPLGLEGGRSNAAFKEMIAHLDLANSCDTSFGFRVAQYQPFEHGDSASRISHPLQLNG